MLLGELTLYGSSFLFCIFFQLPQNDHWLHKHATYYTLRTSQGRKYLLMGVQWNKWSITPNMCILKSSNSAWLGLQKLKLFSFSTAVPIQKPCTILKSIWNHTTIWPSHILTWKKCSKFSTEHPQNYTACGTEKPKMVRVSNSHALCWWNAKVLHLLQLKPC